MSSQVRKDATSTPPAEVSEEVREQIAVHGALRCPYCHDACEPSGSVACRDCLARHHAACWQEQGACSSCGSTHRLVAEAAPELTRDDLLDLLRQGKSEAVEAYYREQGHTPEVALRKAAELAFAEVAGGTVPAHMPLSARMLFFAQTLGLTGIMGVALVEEAESAVWGGLALLLGFTFFMAIVRLKAGKAARGIFVSQLLLLLAAVVCAPLLINLLDIPAWSESPPLGALAFGLAIWSLVHACRGLGAQLTAFFTTARSLTAPLRGRSS